MKNISNRRFNKKRKQKNQTRKNAKRRKTGGKNRSFRRRKKGYDIRYKTMKKLINLLKRQRGGKTPRRRKRKRDRKKRSRHGVTPKQQAENERKKAEKERRKAAKVQEILDGNWGNNVSVENCGEGCKPAQFNDPKRAAQAAAAAAAAAATVAAKAAQNAAAAAANNNGLNIIPLGSKKAGDNIGALGKKQVGVVASAAADANNLANNNTACRTVKATEKGITAGRFQPNWASKYSGKNISR